VLRDEAGVGKTRLTQAFEAIGLLGGHASFGEPAADAPGGDGKLRRFDHVVAGRDIASTSTTAYAAIPLPSPV